MITPNDDESLDLITATWSIFQLKKGHRFSTDDIVVAWRASVAMPNATRLLDLGSGLGSVGLSTLYLLNSPDATLVSVEAQAVSVALARKTLAYNQLEGRVGSVHSDFREVDLFEPGTTFDLITGSPPYIPTSRGVMSPHPQRAACRMELRGSVYDYCKTAKRWLAPGGRFVFVMLAGDPRTEDAAVRAGFHITERWDYIFREGKTPHITTLVCAHPSSDEVASRHTGQTTIRDSQGEWTEEYLDFRTLLGFKRS